MKDNITNFVDDKISRKIINALTKMDFETCNKLADNSGIPVSRLQEYIFGTEKITQLDKDMLILYVAELNKDDEKRYEDSTMKQYSSLKEFQQRKVG